MAVKTLLANIKGPKGDPGEKGDTGTPGQGVPTGGMIGQILVKKSETDFDAEWQTLQAGGSDTYEIVTCDIADITEGLSEFTVSNFSKTFAETYVNIMNSRDVILKANYAAENYVYMLHPSAVNNESIAFSTATNDKALTITIKNDNSLTCEIVSSDGGVVPTDATPTKDSTNSVQSGGVYTALEGKQDKITGIENQIVAIGADGNAIVIDGSVIKNIEYTPSTADGGNNVLKINLTNGTSQSFNIKNGSKGDKGDKGDAGLTSKTLNCTAYDSDAYYCVIAKVDSYNTCLVVRENGNIIPVSRIRVNGAVTPGKSYANGSSDYPEYFGIPAKGAPSKVTYILM